MKNYTREESNEMMHVLLDVMYPEEVIKSVERYFSSDDMGRCIESIARDWEIDLEGFGRQVDDEVATSNTTETLQYRIFKLSIGPGFLSVDRLKNEFTRDELAELLADKYIFNNEAATREAHSRIIEALHTH